MNRDRVIAGLRALLPHLRSQYAVASLGLFGSIARGDGAESSDIDVLVAFEPGATVTLMTLARVKCDLEDALGRAVDLVEDHPQLRPAFRDQLRRDLIRVA